MGLYFNCRNLNTLIQIRNLITLPHLIQMKIGGCCGGYNFENIVSLLHKIAFATITWHIKASRHQLTVSQGRSHNWLNRHFCFSFKQLTRESAVAKVIPEVSWMNNICNQLTSNLALFSAKTAKFSCETKLCNKIVCTTVND